MKRGAFILKGSNFFERPERKGHAKRHGAPIWIYSTGNIGSWKSPLPVP